jgi:hypothetical protein
MLVNYLVKVEILLCMKKRAQKFCVSASYKRREERRRIRNEDFYQFDVLSTYKFTTTT